MPTFTVPVIEDGRELGEVTATGPYSGTYGKYGRPHWHCLFMPVVDVDERANGYDIVDSPDIETVKKTAATWFRFKGEGVAG